MALSSFLTAQDIQRLSDLLLSENSSDLEIGFQILMAHPDAVEQVHRELLLMVHLSAQPLHAKQAKALLKQCFSSTTLQTWEETFEIFHRYHDLYTPQDFDAAWIWFEKHEAVRATYQPLIAQKTAYVRAYFSLAETIAEFYKKRLDWAERYYHLVLSYCPHDIPTLFRLGNLERDHHHNYDKALQHYQKVLQLRPNHYYTMGAIALLYLDYFHDANTALSWIQRALEAYPNDEQLLVWLADIYMTPSPLQDFQKGEAIIHQCLDNNPYNTAAWIIYGNHLWITQKAIKRAESIYQEGLRHNPNNYNLLGNLAEFYERVYGDGERAQALYLQSFAIYQNDPYHLGNFVRLLVVRMNDLEQAKPYYRHLKTLFFGSIKRQAEWTAQQWKEVQQAEQILLEQFPDLAA